MEATAPNHGSYLRQVWLVLALAIAYGAALAGADIGLSGRIAENKKNETYSQIPALCPGALAEKTKEEKVGDTKVFQAINKSGEQVGWVIPASSNGFADKLQILVGLSTDLKKVTGIYVLFQKETPALGDKITEPVFQKQYAGLAATKNIMVVKTKPVSGKNEIQAITAATISSKAVTQAVNDAVTWFRKEKGA